MIEERVRFWSQGTSLSAVLRKPNHEGPLPLVLAGPVWLQDGLDNPISSRLHGLLVDAGFAVLHWDTAGFGDSDGPAGWIRPEAQAAEISDAISWSETRPDIDAERVAVFGAGATGAAAALYAGADDDRIRCLAVMSAISSGRTWLRDMRPSSDWQQLLARVAEDRRRRAAGEPGALVDPLTELMVTTPARSHAPVRQSFGPTFHLACAESILRCQPIDVVYRLETRPLLIIAVGDDDVTPIAHSRAIFERTTGPARLIVQRGVSHYGAYHVNLERIADATVQWFRHSWEGRGGPSSHRDIVFFDPPNAVTQTRRPDAVER